MDQDKFSILEPLLQGLTHEIRNPVQGILASADALRCKYEDDPASNRLLEMILRECGRIEQIMKDLMDLVRPVMIDSTKAQSLKHLLEETIRNFQQQNAATAVEFACKLPVKLVDIYMDRESMRRAIVALLENASESAADGLQVRVLLEEAEDQLEIRIEDNGEGILPEKLGRVLEPFFSTRPKKAGLGLSIAERIVRLHGGQLSVHSQKGEGTIVLLRLPRVV